MSYSEALEQQVAMLRFIDTSQGGRYLDIHASMGGISVSSLKGVYRRHLAEADPFYWSAAMCGLLESVAAEMPSWYLESTALVVLNGFAWFSRPLRLSLWDDEPSSLTALSWHVETEAGDPGISLVAYVENDPMRAGGYPADLVMWRYGMAYDEIIHEVPAAVRIRQPDRFTEKMRYFAAMCVLLQQRILVAPQQRAERHARKRLQATGYQHDPLIRVIELRRKQSRPNPYTESEPREWSCQWIVSGHWHHYWMHSDDNRRVLQPRWLMPYVKGPDDKPLRPPRAKVFAVVR